MVVYPSMRRPRIKAEGEGFYHVVSRIGGKRFLIDETEKRILLGMIRGAAAFSGVEVYTYAVMSNHFHLLVRVPRKREVSDKELERRMIALYGPAKFAAVLKKWARWTRRHEESRVEDEKERLRKRMYDLSQFCKTFKEAYTQDYNRRHENTGTIWEGRFKSILLEGSYRAMTTVAGFSTIPAASIAAASGRQRNAMSDELRASLLAAGSLRTSSGSVTTSRSRLSARRSRILSPVVPAEPSIKTFFTCCTPFTGRCLSRRPSIHRSRRRNGLASTALRNP